jgi:hypothetical protein
MVENEMGAIQRVHITKVFANCPERPSRGSTVKRDGSGQNKADSIGRH